MLESITLKNLALIKESELTLRPGLNILTGETGAGKSIIIGSIRLALGEKASKNIIRRGEEYALIELVFTSKRECVADKLRELDIPEESDGSIVIQRKILESRSVCKCNGETVSSRALRELASLLINIHGQNDTQSLLDARNYRDILDDFGGDEVLRLRDNCGLAYKEYKALLDELDEARDQDSNKEKEIALSRFEVEEIEAARLVVGEDSELEEKYKLMKNSQRIVEYIGKAYGAINDEQGAGALTGVAVRELTYACQYDEGLDELLGKISTAEDIIKDAMRDMQDYMDRMDFSEAEYREVENRLDVYNHLKNKYGNTVEDVLAYAEGRKAYITKMEDYDAYLASLEVKIGEGRRKCLKLAGSLTEERVRAGKELENKLVSNLVDLNFANVSVEVKVDSDEAYLSASGMDKVDFLVSFNLGEPVKSLSQVASGGELSRFMLALKAITADREEIETLVFDEIDSGISGKTAWNVSQKMAVIGKEHQVIVITHLPQIAAMADSHYLIEKRESDDSTVTDIARLGDAEAELEIARMVSGGELTEAGISNAKELLENAKSCKMDI